MGDMIGIGGQGEFRTGGAFYRCDFTPRVILVRSNQGGVIALGLGIIASVDGDDIALQVFRVIITGESGLSSVFHADTHNGVVFVIQEFQRADKGAVRSVLRLRQKQGLHPVIVRICAIGVCLPGAQTVGVVLVPGGFRAGFGGGKLPAVAPGECPVAAVEIGQGIADLVVGKRSGGGLAVMGHSETSEQILPLAVAVSIGVPIPQIVKRRVGTKNVISLK